MKTAFVLVAAGSGKRLGSTIPKALVDLAGKPLFARAAEVLVGEPRFSAGVIVAPPGFGREVSRYASRYHLEACSLHVIEGGSERQDSVRAGLRALPGDVEIVLVHDAARPFVTSALVTACLQAAGEHGAATAALPVTDTIKEVDARGAIVRTVDRTELRAVQTPQAFQLRHLIEVHDRAARENLFFTDDAALIERYGGKVWTVPGDPNNMKVTSARDLAWARWFIQSEGPR